MRWLVRIVSTTTLVLATSAASSGLAAQAPHACDLVSAADLAEHTGRRELAEARQIRGTNDQSEPGGVLEPGGTECAFMGTSLTVELQRLASIDDFHAAAQRRVQAGELQPHDGLGDAAWFRYNSSLGQHGFVVRVGSSLVILMMDTGEAGSADEARSRLHPLAQAVAAKLR